jgi:hypothetical protein
MSITTITTQQESILTNPVVKDSNRWRGLGRIVWQTTAALIIGILLLEAYFRLAGVGGQEFVQPDLKMGCHHIPGKRVIWRMEGYSADKLSSVGLRDSEHSIVKPEGTYRIALLGDSAVESMQVRMDQTFGKVLEKLLNAQLHKTSMGNIKQFEVINFGCSSYSTGQELLQYEQEADKYKPDAIVLLYNRSDSLENVVSAKDRKRAEGRPYFYLDQAGQLQQDNSILVANKDKLKTNALKEFLRKNSAIYGVLTQADFSLSLNEPRYCKLKNWWQALLNLPSKLNGKQPIVSKAYYADQSDIAVTKALLERLSQEAKEKKRVFILTVFPNIVNYKDLKEQAKELKALAGKKDFQYLDLSNSFLACKDPSSNFLQYHFSEKGHAVVAYDLFNMFCRNLNSNRVFLGVK